MPPACSERIDRRAFPRPTPASLNGAIFLPLYAGDMPPMVSRALCAVAAAGAELVQLMAGHRVECHAEGRDRYGRTLATCYADGADLGGAMVASGWAWAFRRYSVRYVDLEARAASLALGIHSHACDLPAAYRAEHRALPVKPIK